MVTAFISKYFSGGYTGSGASMKKPMPTVTAIDHNSVVSVHISPDAENNNKHYADVQAFLIKYNHTDMTESVDKPLDTIATKDRFGIVTVKSEKYRIVDIGMRMLTPRELYNAQGFPADYEIETDCDGKAYPKTKQIARCGNSVPPPFAIAIVRANAPEWCEVQIKTMQELNRMIAV